MPRTTMQAGSGLRITVGCDRMSQEGPLDCSEVPKGHVIQCSGLNCGPQKYVHLDLQNVTLFEISIFADVIKVRLSRQDLPGVGGP